MAAVDDLGGGSVGHRYEHLIATFGVCYGEGAPVPISS